MDKLINAITIIRKSIFLSSFVKIRRRLASGYIKQSFPTNKTKPITL